MSQAFISHKKHVNLQLSPGFVYTFIHFLFFYFIFLNSINTIIYLIGLKSNEELPFKVTLQDIDLQALKETNWPGRCQIIEKKNSSVRIFFKKNKKNDKIVPNNIK